MTKHHLNTGDFSKELILSVPLIHPNSHKINTLAQHTAVTKTNTDKHCMSLVKMNDFQQGGPKICQKILRLPLALVQSLSMGDNISCYHCTTIIYNLITDFQAQQKK